MNYNPKWAITSKTVNACARWWRELSDFLSNTNPDRIFPRKEKFVFVEIRPHIGREVHMAPQNIFGPNIIHRNSLCESLKRSGVCKWRGCPRAMQYEGCACASLAFLGSEIGNYSNG